MLIEVTRAELEVARRALRAAILLGDTYFTFCPDVSCAGAKVHFSTGNHQLEVEMSERARELLGKLTDIACPDTLARKKALMRDMEIELSNKNKVPNPYQIEMDFGT